MISKPRKKLSDRAVYPFRAHKANDFSILKKSKLAPIGAWELANHSNHHIFSQCKISDQFYVTGSSDCTFKIWAMSTEYFVTPCNKSCGVSLKTEDFKDPRQKKKPFKLVFSSDETWHKGFVTACTSFVRDELYNMLITGDGEGKIIASYFDFEFGSGKFERIEKIFTQEKAHEGPVLKLERYGTTDNVVSCSSDMTFAFWNIIKGQCLNKVKKHKSPLQTFQFMNNYQLLVTSSNTELFIWKVNRFLVKGNNNDGNQTPAKSQQSVKKANNDALQTPESQRDALSPNKDLNQNTDTKREDENSKEEIKVTIQKRADLEDTTTQYPHIKIFGSNVPRDYILFITHGPNIRLMNILNGNYFGEMKDAHFKGTFNFGLIIDDGPTSRLNDIFKDIGTKIQEGTHVQKPNKRRRTNQSITETEESEMESEFKDLLIPHFKEQLSHY